MVHGGIRYLQHADLYHIRESSRERSALLRIAPHLVYPLPIVVPTYGRGLRSKQVLRAGMSLYDLLTLDRNWGIPDLEQRIPPTRALSRQECLEMFPSLERHDLSGGMLFYDGQMYSPPRLALSFLKSAVEVGAAAANYVEVTNFVRDRDRVVGVDAQGQHNGDRLRLRGKVVLNAAGPWAERLLQQDLSLGLHPQLTFSRDAALVVKRRLSKN